MRLAVGFFISVFLLLNLYGLFSMAEFFLEKRWARQDALHFLLMFLTIGFSFVLLNFCYRVYFRWFDLSFVFKAFVAVFSGVLLFCIVWGAIDVLIVFYLLTLFFIFFIIISGVEKEGGYGKNFGDFVVGWKSVSPGFGSFLKLMLAPLAVFTIVFLGKWLLESSRLQGVEKVISSSAQQERESHDEIRLEYDDNEFYENIYLIISLFKNLDVKELSSKVFYPIYRGAPLKTLRTEKDFIENFDIVFDRDLIEKISRSKVSDWHQLGSRGFLLESGLVWLNYDATKILQINYSSESHKIAAEAIVARDKEGLHASVQEYTWPILKADVGGFIIRVDDVDDAYRYSAWKKPKTQADKPDLVLYNGEYEAQGSAGNHSYVFDNGSYKYSVSRVYIGMTNSEVDLSVLRGEEEVFRAEGMLSDY